MVVRADGSFDERQAKAMQQQLASMMTDRMKFKIIFALFAVVAFYMVPVTAIGIIATVLSITSGGPVEVMAILKFMPFAAISIGAVIGTVVFNKKSKEAKEQDLFDAQRRQALLERTGTANEKARRMADVESATEMPSRVMSAFAGAASRAAARVPSPSSVDTPTSMSFSPPSGFTSAPPKTSGMTVERAAGRVRCTWCGKHVSVAQGDDESGMATCVSCGHTFSMREELRAHMGMRAKPLGLDASVVANTCTIVHETGTIFGYTLPIMAFVVMLLFVPESLQKQRFEIVGAIGLFVVVMGVIAYVMNGRRTVYTITPETFIVGIHGFMGREIGQWNKGDVEQIFVRQKKHTRRETDTRYGRSSSNKKRKVTYYTYDVILLDVAGRETRLSADLKSQDHALYIEQEIENRFAIVDRAMGKGPSR
jgi:hypothetical protein